MEDLELKNGLNYVLKIFKILNFMNTVSTGKEVRLTSACLSCSVLRVVGRNFSKRALQCVCVGGGGGAF